MTPEVLAPGGSLDHALWALEGGADAVYVGMQKFSARSHADNLTLDDMAALTAVAKSKNARVFCALNIILDADETAEAVVLAWELHFRGVDALIVQDLGVALALRKFGPPIDLHASTQAAVHNASGVAALKALGFCRVVLARELTMDEIRALVGADPAMEYEVFVHGALCYAVSGNCMASGLMIGRSANRGDCGQICRTKFELDYLIPGPKRRESPHEEGLPEGIHAPPGELTWKGGAAGAFASMNDLELGARIRELRACGVQSFKIEGRMKPPAYSFNTARAYKAFLEGGRDAEAWGWLDEARMRYGRLPSAGWFDGHKALAQTNPGWAGTLGMPLGVVSHAAERSVRVPTGARTKVFARLSKGDGVLILGPVAGQVFRGALTGEVSILGSGTKAAAELPLADKIGFDAREGTLWLVSRHDGKLPVKKTGKTWRHPIGLVVTIAPESPTEAAAQVRRSSITVTSPDLGGLSFSEVLLADEARGDRRLEASLAEVLRASDSRFGPGELVIHNTAGALFIQPKVLKEFRRRFYAHVEAAAQAFVAALPGRLAAEVAVRKRAAGKAPLRGTLSPLTGVNKLVGFVVEWENLRAEHLPQTRWGLALPLAPFTPDEGSYFRRLREFLLRLKNEGVTAVLPGLSNPGHLTWLGRLRAEGLATGSWFADWGFHSANPWTPAQLAEALPGLEFVVPWLESPDGADKSYFPPLFTSRACMLRNSFGDLVPSALPTPGNHAFDSRDWISAQVTGKTLARPGQGPRCPDGCAGHFSARLTQGKRNFRVEARDCINYLIAEENA
ncbi:MAG: peptidase U32 family protein [Spirochaetales bacterium]